MEAGRPGQGSVSSGEELWDWQQKGHSGKMTPEGVFPKMRLPPGGDF